MDLATYSIIPIAILGAIVGSFLNVVVYRLPLGLSIRQPRWSFCPHCTHVIRPQHNIPIIGWLLLRGKCHDCKTQIAPIYPFIECLTAMVFVSVWDALFIACIVPGVGIPETDWPIAIAMIVLFAALLACSAMDIDSYSVDIRVLVFAMVVGTICHTVWTVPGVFSANAGDPIPSDTLPDLLPPGLCLIGVAMGVTWLLTMGVAALVIPRREPECTTTDPEKSERDNQASPDSPSDETSYTRQDNTTFRPLPILLFSAVLLGLVVWPLLYPAVGIGSRFSPAGERGFAVCFVLMVILVLVSKVKREADEEIIEEIESERESARGMALREFAWLFPAIAVGLVLCFVLRSKGSLGMSWPEFSHTVPESAWWAGHLAGAAYAIASLVWAAALGWAVRILGTLGLGKESLGTGDIYIMAAIGAAGGLWLALFGFFLACLLALTGVLATLFWKTSRAIPLGPWLALGAIAGIWLLSPLLAWFRPAGSLIWSVISEHPATLLGG